MEGILLGLILLVQVFTLWNLIGSKKNLFDDVRALYGSIARDLNNVTRTIALYSGAESPPKVNGEGEAVDPIEAARRKAEIWRTARRGGSR